MDPATGQFTQQDPIGLAGGLNVYGFAAGDPVNFSDPFGLCPEEYGGDGETSSLADCPEGKRGYGMNLVGATGDAGLLDPITWLSGSPFRSRQMAKISFHHPMMLVEAHPKYLEEWHNDLPARQSMHITTSSKPPSDPVSEVYEVANGRVLVLDFDKSGKVARIELV